MYIAQGGFIGKINVTVFESEFLNLSKIPLISEGTEERKPFGKGVDIKMAISRPGNHVEVS
jgi:hypothetical protein